MKMTTTSAEMGLVSLIHSINKDPESWEKWMCLHIPLSGLTTDEDMPRTKECTRSLLESCFQDIEGTAYFCEPNDIYVICKNISRTVLREIGQHISDFSLDEDMEIAHFNIFDLAHDGQGFVDYYCRRDGSFTIFSLPDEHPNKKKIISPAPIPQQQNPTPASEVKRVSMKVLLVDDDPITRWMVRNALRFECEFAVAPNGNKALSLYNSYQPDLVFLDINLPDRDGISVLDWIIKHDPGAYVVMFSSEGHLDTIVDTLEEGAKGFIAKPFRKEQLIHYLNSCPNLH